MVHRRGSRRGSRRRGGIPYRYYGLGYPYRYSNYGYYNYPYLYPNYYEYPVYVNKKIVVETPAAAEPDPDPVPAVESGINWESIYPIMLMVILLVFLMKQK